MGQPMMWRHVDGSETEGVSDRTFVYAAAEQDVNRQYLWPEGYKEYALVFNLDSPDAEATWTVKRIGDPEALIPPEVREAGEAAMNAFLESLRKQEETRMAKAAAPHFLADAIASLDLAAEWEYEGDGASVILADHCAVVSTDDGTTWHGLAYPVLEPSDSFNIASINLAEVFEAVEAWLYERLS